jgi:hypothetical protein
VQDKGQDDDESAGELRSLPNGTQDEFSGGTITRKVSTGTAITSGTAVNTTNYPHAKDAGSVYIILDSDSSKETGTIGTDSASGDGTVYYELATPTTESVSADARLKVISGGSINITDDNDLPAEITMKYRTCKNQGWKD